jgi:hypothetical protein
MQGLFLTLTLVGLYFVAFPIKLNRPSRKRQGNLQTSGFLGYNERPFEPDNGDPLDNINYIKPKFIYPGATDYKPEISKSAEWADPLRNLPSE